MANRYFPDQTYKVGTGWKVKRADNDSVQCSLVKELTVFIEPTPRQKIELLMKKYPNQEWLGYLVGRVSEKGNYFVEELTVPPHKEAYMASAEAEPFHIPDNCIGVIHSHHTMGASHSVTDKEYVDMNFPISITVARKEQVLEFDAISYQTTPCGKHLTSKGVVKYVSPPPAFDTESFMKEAVKNIDEGKRVYQPVVVPRLGVYGGDFITGENGRVMTQAELDAHMKDIWKDRDIGGFE